jgi:hypothetical protein
MITTLKAGHFPPYRSSLLTACWDRDEEGDIPVEYIACRQVVIIKIREKRARQKDGNKNS